MSRLLPYGMVTKNVTIDQFKQMVLDCIDDGIFRPAKILRCMGMHLSNYAINKRLPQVYGFSMMQFVMEVRIERMVKLAKSGRLKQKEAAALLGWNPTTACVLLKKYTGKTYEELRE